MRKTVGFLMLVLAASATAAQASPLTLKIGAATSAGDVSFTLSMNSGDSVYVSVPFAGVATPAEKASAIFDSVANADVVGTWQAVPATVGVALSFQHLVADTWVDVDSVTGLNDTTGGGTQLETDQIVDFTLNLDPDAVATGFDLEGGPSFITISVTNTLAFTRAIQMGDTPQSLVDQFQAFLAEQAPAGLSVTRSAPTSVTIRLAAGSSSALNWQVTDTGLMLVTKGGGVIVIDASLIER